MKKQKILIKSAYVLITTIIAFMGIATAQILLDPSTWDQGGQGDGPNNGDTINEGMMQDIYQATEYVKKLTQKILIYPDYIKITAPIMSESDVSADTIFATQYCDHDGNCIQTNSDESKVECNINGDATIGTQSEDAGPCGQCCGSNSWIMCQGTCRMIKTRPIIMTCESNQLKSINTGAYGYGVCTCSGTCQDMGGGPEGGPY